MNNQFDKFDIIVIGGGIVGLSFAACLQNTPFTIAILDTHIPKLNWDKNTYALRVSAINRASEIILNNAGIWQNIIAERASPFKKIQVFDTEGFGNISFDHRDIAEPNLGHIIENRVIQKVLLQQIKNSENIHYLAPIKIQDFWHGTDKITTDNNIHVQCDNGYELTAKLLVGADGARSWLRQQAGFDWVEKDYGHHAVVCNIVTQLPHQQKARQWFLKEGVLAFLPLSGANDCSIVWSTTPDKAKHLSAVDAEQFCVELADASQLTLGKITSISERASFPLIMRHAKSYVKPRIALIGDAAHTIHPLAGQGVNLGIADAAVLARFLQQAEANTRDIGLLHTLRKLERWRRGENATMLLAMDGFKQLFGNNFKPVVWARSLGLNITDNTLFLKQCFSRKALGMEIMY